MCGQLIETLPGQKQLARHVPPSTKTGRHDSASDVGAGRTASFSWYSAAQCQLEEYASFVVGPCLKPDSGMQDLK